jgi:signal-transduction protein with cAMP-binding, CBS, and nucleotidyltransferase domain
MYREHADKKVSEVMERDILFMDESASVADAAHMMRQKGVSSVIVGLPAKKQSTGIVTERDILYRVVAEHRSPFKTAIKEVMSSPLVTIDGSALLRDAILLMRQKGIRRIPVTSDGSAVGMLTLKSIIGDSRKKDIELIDVELPLTVSKILCPYCESKFEDKQELSKHIDRLHLGSGLLEGDLRRW